MRKDVRLGMTIGGVLLIVIVVYLIVTLGDKGKQTASLDQNESGTPVITDEQSPQNPTPLIRPQPADATTSAHDARDVHPIPTDAHADHPQGDHGQGVDVGGNTGGVAAAENHGLLSPPEGTDWNRLLNPPDDARLSQRLRGPAQQNPSQPGNGGEEGSRLADASQPAADDSTPTAGRTHTVAEGETFSSISQKAFGSIRYVNAIMAANPGIDPHRLRPGMVINLPDASTLQSHTPARTSERTDAAEAGARPAAAQIDPNSSYVVQSGDSLYRIAVKLYGDSRMQEKIYEANKDRIGSDPAKLKLNQVLVLPEPPLRTD